MTRLSTKTAKVARSRSIKRRVRLAMGMQMVLLAIGSAAFLWTQHQLRDSRAWTTHTHEVIALIEQLRADTFVQVAGLRAYGFSGNQEYLDQQLAGRVRYSELIKRIIAKTRDNPSQQVRAAKMVNLLQDWRDKVVEPALEASEDAASPAIVGSHTTNQMADIILRQGSQLMAEMLEEERRLLAEQLARTERMADRMIGMIIVILALGLMLGLMMMGSVQAMISDPLSELSGLARRLAKEGKGDVPYRHRGDEIGTLARSLEDMRQSVQGQLQDKWVEERTTDAVRRLQGCESLEKFGEELLRVLCTDLNAGYGLAFRWNDHEDALQWCAGYGMAGPERGQLLFKSGEGLIGQAMQVREPIKLDTVPEGYRQVVSGLGAAPPQSLVIMPFVARGEVVAVVELGLLEAMNASQANLLDSLRTPVALAWDALARALRTRSLLKESQTQAEELKTSEEALRVQQEELRATNEALTNRSQQLEAQGKQLKSSEESLRAQAEELRVSNAALEEKSEALQARQSELEQARKALEQKANELEQASQYKSEFLANMSHELRTPLNSMLILSKTLAENPDGRLSQDEIESAQVINDSGNSLLTLINDILDLSKVEAGKLQFHWEEVSLADLFRQLEQRFAPVAQERGLEFVLTQNQGLPDSIISDAQRLTQVITNLLSNAFKFTQQGKVGLLAEPIDGGIVLRVSDSGIGIAPEKLDLVFHAFEQAESGTSRRFGGTGLGLSIVSGMTQQLGGAVRVESELHKGSVFSVYLPLRPEQGIPAGVHAKQRSQESNAPESPTKSVTEASPVVPGTGETGSAVASSLVIAPASAEPTVLVVEDDPQFAKLLCSIATEKGLSVQHASSGAQARDIIERYQIVAALLDIGLPDMDGWDLLAQIRATPALAKVPVHVISGRRKAGDEASKGASSYLTKPVGKDQILAALDQLGMAASAPDRRVLLVMPEKEQADGLATLLRQASLQVVVANEQQEAQRLLGEESFNSLVVSPDLQNPPTSEFLAQAGGPEALPPVLVYSSRPLQGDESLALREHSDSIIVEGARSKERLLDEVNLFLHSVKPPAGIAVQGTRAATGVGGAYNFPGKTVLVVDDDMRNTFALSKALRAHGLSVLMAQDGQKALKQLESGAEIDIVLMDIMMPGMDGYQATRRIRQNPDWQELPVIAVTAKAMGGDREKCLAAGANDYCSKPIDIDRLLSQMQVWLS